MFNPLLNSRRDILWNIKQPGDPYDITKSMIQKLPGQEKIFMGDNLQLVCLFQAAEIQRLTLYLNEYMLKYREIQRQSLDRHSYQEMIKELTQKWNTADLQRKEKTQTVNKLKDFVQKLNKQLQELKKYSKDQVQSKYQQALKQLQEYRRDNYQLKQQRTQMIRQLQQLRTKTSYLQHQLQTQGQQQMSAQVEHIKSSYQTEIHSLKIQCVRFQEENYGLRTRVEELEKRVMDYRSRDDGREVAGLNDTIYKLEGECTKLQNNVAVLRQQNQRLTLIERQRTAEIVTLRDQIRIRDQDIIRYRTESSQMSSRLQQQQSKIRELQDNVRGSRYQQSTDQEQLLQANRKMQKALTDLSLEIQRLNSVLRMKVGQIQQLEKRLKEYEYEFSRTDILRRENQASRTRIEEYARKITDYENSIALLSQQVERLNIELRRKVGELQGAEERHRQLIRQNDELKGRVAMLESRFGQDARSYEESVQKIRRQNEELRIRAQTYGKKLSEYEAKLGLMTQQIQRLNVVLQRTIRERDSLNNQVPELSSIRATYESRVMNLTAQNEEMRRKLVQYVEQLHRVEQYEMKLTSLSMEVKRLNDVLGVKLEDIKRLSELIRQNEGENVALKNQLRQAGQSVIVIQQRESQIMTLRRQLQTTSSQLKIQQDQNNTYRQAVRDLQGSSQQAFDLQQKIVSLSNEIQRLNQVLGRLKQENDQLRGQSRVIPEYETRISMFQTKTVTYERQIQTITTQLHQSENVRRQLESRLGQQSGDLQRKVFELQQRLSSMSLQLQHKNRYIQDYEQKINDSSIKLRQSDQNLAEYTSKMVTMSNEIKRLNDVIMRISQQSDQSKGKLQQYTSFEQQVERDVQQYRRKLSEYENKIALFGVEIERLNHALQDKIRELNTVAPQFSSVQRELDETRYRLQVCEGARGDDQQRQRRAQQEIERLTKIIRTHETKITEITTTIQEYHQKLVIMSQENQRLGGGVQENQQLRRKLAEYARLEQAHQQLGGEHNELLKRLSEYENKMALLSQEVQRLNEVLRGVTSQKDQLVSKLQKFGESEQSLVRQNQDMNRTITQYENKLAVMRQEIQRLEESVRSLKAQKEQSLRTVQQLQDELSRLGPRLPEYESKMKQLIDEVNRLNVLLQRLTQQNDELKGNLQLSAQRMGSELSNAKNIITEYESKFIQLNQQREQLQNILRKSQSDKNELIIRLQSTTKQGDRWNEEVNILKRKISEYEQQMKNLSLEIQRLGGLLQRSTSQNQQLSVRIQNYVRIEQQYTVSSQDNEKKIMEYQNKIAMLSMQLERLNSKYSEEYGQANSKIQDFSRREQQLNNEISNLSRKVAEWQNKAGIMGNEITRLNQALESKIREINSLKAQLTQLTKESEQARYKLRTSDQAYRQVESNFRQASQQIQRLKRLLNDNSTNLAAFQDRAREYLEEIERLNNTLRIKVEETRRWEQRCSQLEGMMQSESGQWRYKYEQVERQFKETDRLFGLQRQQHHALQQSYKRLLAEYEKSKNSLRQYEIMIQKLNQQFDRLQEIIRGQKVKCQEYDRFRQRMGQHESQLQYQVKVLQAQVLRLGKELALNAEHNERLTNHRCQELDLQKRIQEHLSLFVVLFAQIEALRHRLINKEAEVEDVRRSSLAPFMRNE